MSESTREKIRLKAIGRVSYWKGKKRPPFSAETIENMRIAATGRVGYWANKKRPQRSDAWKKALSDGHKGIKLSETHKDNLRKSKLGKLNPMFGKTGSKHHNFIIDRSKLKTDSEHQYDTKYKYWMLKVKERDNYTCVINDEYCDGRLEAHHILPWSKFPELRYNINNGISLCQFHHPHRWADETKLAPFFTEIVLAKAQTIGTPITL